MFYIYLISQVTLLTFLFKLDPPSGFRGTGRAPLCTLSEVKSPKVTHNTSFPQTQFIKASRFYLLPNTSCSLFDLFLFLFHHPPKLHSGQSIPRLSNSLSATDKLLTLPLQSPVTAFSSFFDRLFPWQSLSEQVYSSYYKFLLSMLIQHLSPL